MRLVIDGRRLGAGRTGVGRYLEGLLEEWARTGPPLAETLVVLRDPGGLDRVPRAAGLRAEVVGAGWPGLIWERRGLGRMLRPGDLLFAPTNLLPATWRGRSVLVLFDAIQEVRPGDFPWHVRLRFGHRYRRAARRADRRGGRKPAKVNSSAGSPDAASAATKADGPGIGTTRIPRSIASRTSRNPGSDTSGVPASDTIAISEPASSLATSSRARSRSLCS